MQEMTVFIRGQWFEVEITECGTSIMFINSDDTVEASFYNDEEGARDMMAWMVE